LSGFELTVIYPVVVLLVLPSMNVVPGELRMVAKGCPAGTWRVIVEVYIEGRSWKLFATIDMELAILLYYKNLLFTHST
jgi:hypothetical protein